MSVINQFDSYLKDAVKGGASREQIEQHREMLFSNIASTNLKGKSPELISSFKQRFLADTDSVLAKYTPKTTQPDPSVVNSPQFQRRYKQYYDAGQPLDVAKKNAYEAAKKDLVPEKGLLGHAKDIGLSALKGAIALPEAAVGLVDIPTGGHVGKFLENEGGAVGFRPAEARQALDDLHTEKYKQQLQDFSGADGIGAKLGQVAKNPTLLTNTITNSAPLMLGGGVAGRGLTFALPKMSGLAAGAIGEGAVMAGTQAEAIRNETQDRLLTGKQAGLSLATGVAGSAFGYGGGQIAKKLGIVDVDTLLAQRAATTVNNANKALPRRLIEGATTEGFLEELPQSVSEQMLQNEALDKPIGQGVEEAAVMGTLAGAVMGSGFAGFSNSHKQIANNIQQQQAAIATAYPQAKATLDAALQSGDQKAIEDAQLEFDAVGNAAQNTTQQLNEYGISSSPEFKGILNELGLINSADPLATDIGRKSDNQPFANKKAAQLFQKQNGLVDTHELVQLGRATKFVLRDKAAATQPDLTSNIPEPQAQPPVAEQQQAPMPEDAIVSEPIDSPIPTAEPVIGAPVEPPKAGLAGIVDRVRTRQAGQINTLKSQFISAYQSGDELLANQLIDQAINQHDLPQELVNQWLVEVGQVPAEQVQAKPDMAVSEPVVDQNVTSPLNIFNQEYSTALQNNDAAAMHMATSKAFKSGLTGIEIQEAVQAARQTPPASTDLDLVFDENGVGRGVPKNTTPEQISSVPTDESQLLEESIPDSAIDVNQEGSQAVNQQTASTTTAGEFTQAFNTISKAASEGTRDQVAEYLREGKADRLTYTKPDSIEAALANENYNVQSNDDGSVTVVGVKDSQNNWVGLDPEAQIQAELTHQSMPEAQQESIKESSQELNNAVDQNEMQSGDIGRKSDGKPFANKGAATFYQNKNDLKESHEVVRLGKAAQFVLRPKVAQEERMDVEQKSENQTDDKPITQNTKEEVENARAERLRQKDVQDLHRLYGKASNTEIEKSIERLSKLIQKNHDLSIGQVVSGKRSTRKAVAAGAVDNFLRQRVDLETYLKARKSGEVIQDGEPPLYSRKQPLKPDEKRSGISPIDTIFGALKLNEARHTVTGIIDSMHLSAPVGSKVVFPLNTPFSFEVVASFNDLPMTIQQDATYQDGNGDTQNYIVNAVWHKGTLYINAGDIKGDSSKQLTTFEAYEETLLHEIVGHYGVQQLFGDDYKTKLQALYNALGGVNGIRKIAKANGVDMQQFESTYIQPYTQALKEKKYTEADVQQALVGEMFAFIAQNAKNRPFVQQKLKVVLGYIRQWLREHGPANFLKRHNDADVMMFLAEARKAVTNPDSKTKYEGVRFSRKASPKAAKPLFSYAGKDSKTADISLLDQAKTLDGQGVDNNLIRRQTGWFKGMDDKWRFEIDDSVVEVTPELSKQLPFGKVAISLLKRIKNKDAEGVGVITVSDLISHDKLFMAYPALKKIAVYPSEEDGGALRLNDLDGGISIHINSDIASNEVPSVLLHELQHAIQEYEDFARGENPDSETAHKIASQLSNEVAQVTPDQVYWHSAGEIEARDTVARKNLKSDQRKNSTPYSSQGIPRNQVIVRTPESTKLPREMLKDSDLNADIVHDFLVVRFGHDTINKLEASGKLEIIDQLTDLPVDALNSIMAFHGSPYKLDKFSLEHLGRGDGHQLYGHGLYFSDSKAVSEFYRKNLAKNDDGQLYQVDIDSDSKDILNWEDSLTNQQTILDHLKPLQDHLSKLGVLEQYETMLGFPFEEWNGGELYTVLKHAAKNDVLPQPTIDLIEAVEMGRSDKAASLYLHHLGINGLKYAQSARDGVIPTGSSNYVIFDDSAIQITDTFFSQNPNGIEGYYHNGRVTLVAANLTPETVIPAFLHEMGGHAGMQGLMKPSVYNAIMQQFDQMVAAKNPLALEAKKRAEVETDPEVQKQEYLPYLITVATEAQQAGNGKGGAFQAVQRFIWRVIRAIKARMVDKFGVNLKLNPDDIVALAERMVQRVAKSPVKNASVEPKRSLNEANHSPFQKAIDDVVAGNTQDRFFNMGSTPDVLKMLGLPDTKITIKGKTIEKVMAQHLGIEKGTHSNIHNLTPDTLRQLPKQINEPVAVFKSGNDATRQGYVVLTELTERDANSGKDKPVIVALHLNKTKQGVELINVASIYGKNSLSALQKSLSSELLYWHKEKGQNFVNAFGLQLPSQMQAQSTSQTKGSPSNVGSLQLQPETHSEVSLSTTNIKTNEDLVKYQSGKPLFSRRHTDFEGIPQAPTQAKEWAKQRLKEDFVQGYSLRKTGEWIRYHAATPLHIALTDKQFKPVFDLIQERMNHVAAESSHAMNKAPELLGRRENFADFRKETTNAISKVAGAVNIGRNQYQTDMNAAGKALFDGTRIDEKVYSNKELEQQGLTPDQIKRYREMRAAIDTSLEQAAKTHMSIVAKVEDIFLSSQIHRLHDLDLPLKKHREQLEATLKAVRDAMNPKDQLDARTIKRIDKALKQIDDIAKKTEHLQATGYAPMMRFGDHVLYVGDKTTGETKLYEMFETERERNRALESLKQAGVLTSNDEVSTSVKNPNEYKLFKEQGVNPETMALFAKEAGLDQDTMYQAYLKLAIAPQSSLKRMIHRKGVAGFSENAERVVSAFVISNARRSANLLYNQDIDSATMAIGDGKVQNYAQNLVEYTRNPMEEAASLRSFLFFMNMGFSFRYGLLNLTQPFIQTLPELSRYLNAAQSSKLILSSNKLAWQSMRKDGEDALYGENSEFKADYEMLKRKGLLDPQNIWALQGRERGRSNAGSVWDVVQNASGTIAQLTETINRRTAMLTALRAAKSMGPQKLKQKGFDSPFEFAAHIIQSTQGVMNKGNRPPIARGIIGAPLMVFRTFSIQYVEQMIRLMKNPQYNGDRDKMRKALAFLMLILFGLAGAAGLPFVKDLIDVYETGRYYMGKPVNFERDVQELFGKDVAEHVLYGSINTFLFDMHGSTGAGDLLPGTRALHPDTGLAKGLLETGGATGGFINKIMDGTEAAVQGKYKLAGQTLAPRAVGSLWQSADIATTGEYRTKYGNNLSEGTVLDSALKALDLNPTGFAQMGRTRMLEREDTAIRAAAQKRFREELIEAKREGDKERIGEIKDDIKAWNKSNPKYPVDIADSSIARSVKRKDAGWEERNKVPKGMEWVKELR